MRCKEAMLKLNDLLDRTLTAGEEREVQAHLAVCPACRNEYQLIKNADDMLRETVLEMVGEIEVPANLSQRIVESLTGEKRRTTGINRLFGFLRAPAFAAAIMMLVVATVAFGYNKLFTPSQENPAVVLSTKSQPATGNTAETETAPLPDNGHQEPLTQKDSIATEAPYNAVTPVTPETTLMADNTDSSAKDTAGASAEEIARQNAPPGRGGGETYDATEEKAADLEHAPTIAGEDSQFMASDQSLGDGKMPGSVSSRAALRQGTLQEAAREVGFTPVVPGYLPPKAELKEITWVPGTVYQEYLVKRNSFMLTQSRVAEPGMAGTEGGQLINLNGAKAYLQETSPGGDPSDVYTTVRWQREGWVFTVEGKLPRAEIIKVALSIP